MKAFLFLVMASLLTVPAVAAESGAGGCDPNNVDVQCVFWEAVGLVTPDRCDGANNFVTCTILVILDDLTG